MSRAQRQHARDERRLQLPLGGDVGEARAHERARERRRRAPMRSCRPLSVQPRSARRAERLAAQRVVDDRDERVPGVAAGDRDGPLGNAVEEVDGAVERVDDPLEPALARAPCALLAEHGVAGPLVAQQACDQRLGVAVGIRDRIGLRALVVDAGGRAVEALDEQRAGRLRGPHGEVEEGVRIGGGQEWRGPDLNRRHPGFQPSALPAELPRRGPHQATTGWRRLVSRSGGAIPRHRRPPGGARARRRRR